MSDTQARTQGSLSHVSQSVCLACFTIETLFALSDTT